MQVSKNSTISQKDNKAKAISAELLEFNLKTYLKQFGRGGAVKLLEEKASVNESMTKLFVEQSLALPESAKNG